MGEAISSKEACVVNPADDYCKAWMEVLCMAFSSGRGFQEGAVCVWAQRGYGSSLPPLNFAVDLL